MSCKAFEILVKRILDIARNKYVNAEHRLTGRLSYAWQAGKRGVTSATNRAGTWMTLLVLLTLNSEKLSAQSPPMRTNASPLVAFDRSAISSRHCKPHTHAGQK